MCENETKIQVHVIDNTILSILRLALSGNMLWVFATIVVMTEEIRTSLLVSVVRGLHGPMDCFSVKILRSAPACLRMESRRLRRVPSMASKIMDGCSVRWTSNGRCQKTRVLFIPQCSVTTILMLLCLNHSTIPCKNVVQITYNILFIQICLVSRFGSGTIIACAIMLTDSRVNSQVSLTWRISCKFSVWISNEIGTRLFLKSNNKFAAFLRICFLIDLFTVNCRSFNGLHNIV